MRIGLSMLACICGLYSEAKGQDQIIEMKGNSLEEIAVLIKIG